MTKSRATIASLLVVAALAVAGCGGSDDAESVPDTPETATQTTTEETAPSTGTTPVTPKPKPEPAAATVVTIRVVGARPQGGIARPTFERNAQVVLVVRSDVVDQAHFHGYDVSRPVGPGRIARLRFNATIPGRFELELEERGVLLADVTVR